MLNSNLDNYKNERTFTIDGRTHCYYDLYIKKKLLAKGRKDLLRNQDNLNCSQPEQSTTISSCDKCKKQRVLSPPCNCSRCENLHHYHHLLFFPNRKNSSSYPWEDKNFNPLIEYKGINLTIKKNMKDKVTELRNNYEKMKEELCRTKNEKEAGDKYIEKLENEVKLKYSRINPELIKKNIRKENSQECIRAPIKYRCMLDKSFNVLESVSNICSDDRAKLKGGINYYYEKEPEYNSVIMSQKNWIESLPDKDSNLNRESTDLLIETDYLNLNNSKFGEPPYRSDLIKNYREIHNEKEQYYKSSFANELNNALSNTIEQKKRVFNNRIYPFTRSIQYNTNNNYRPLLKKEIISRICPFYYPSSKTLSESLNNSSPINGSYFNSFDILMKNNNYNERNNFTYVMDSSEEYDKKEKNYNENLLNNTISLNPDFKETYTLIGPNDLPFIINGKKLIGLPVIPLKGTDRKIKLDLNCNPILVDRNGDIINQSELKPILLEDGRPIVDNNNLPILGINGKYFVDKEGNPIILPFPLIDKNNQPIQGVLARNVLDNDSFHPEQVSEINEKEDSYSFALKALNNKSILINGKILKGIKVLPLIGIDGKELRDQQGNIILVDQNGNVISQSQLKPIFFENERPLVDENNRPILGVEGKYFVDKNDKPLTLQYPLKDSNGQTIRGIIIQNSKIDNSSSLQNKFGNNKIFNKSYILTGPNGLPFIVNGKTLIGEPVLPLIGIDGKNILDPNGNPILVDKNGQIISQGQLKPIFLENGRPLVDKNNRPILGIDEKFFVDKNCNPITLSYSLMDKNNNPIIGIIANPSLNPEKKKLYILTRNNGKPLLNNNGNYILVDDVTPLLGNDGKPILDENSNVIFIGKDQKPIKGSGLTLLLDQSGKPIFNQDGKPIFLDHNGNPINSGSVISSFHNFLKNNNLNKNNNDGFYNKKDIYSLKNNINIQKISKLDKGKNKKKDDESSLMECLKKSGVICFACEVGCGVSSSGYSPMTFSPYRKGLRRKEVTPLKDYDKKSRSKKKK